MTQAFDPRDMILGSAALLAALRSAHPERCFGERPALPRASIRGLVAHAAKLSRVPAEIIAGRDRQRYVVHLRRAVAMAAREYPYSLPQIGRAMGDRDHSTVLNLLRTGDTLASRSLEFAWFAERVATAGACEPLGPGRRYVPEPAFHDDPFAPPPGLVPPAQLEAAVIAAQAADLAVRSYPGEYVPRHALAPVMAVVETVEPVRDPEDSGFGSVVSGSRSLLAALRREHPERFAQGLAA